MKIKQYLLVISTFILICILIIAIYLNALSGRYMKLNDDGSYIFDKWTRTVYECNKPLYRLK